MCNRISTIFLIYIPAVFVVSSILLVTLLKWIPVTFTPLMIIREFQNIGNNTGSIKYEWIPLEEISEDMIRTVIVAEDQKFLWHNGFDVEEFTRMKQNHKSDNTLLRGCSTISQQTAKNCFTFCTHTGLRKAIEAYYTVLIEKIWGKKRIMEVYLNVAEMGPGIYGIEAAARCYYHRHAADLTLADASSLACCLPNPLQRNPDWANRYLSKKRSDIATAAANTTLPPW